MTAEQQFDLIAEAGWRVCEDGRITVPSGETWWSAGFCAHLVDGETDLFGLHYDTPKGTHVISARGCFWYRGYYVYEQGQRGKERAGL